ncbi:MAG: hypothetical protein ABSG64_02305 [Solirubrobacteraceae bacterium]|jgi:hypothetical protein
MPLTATMMLCDAAQEVGGKLYILGAGWNVLTGPDQPANVALAILIEVPWDEANLRHSVEATLLTDDGDRVEVNGFPIGAETQLEVGRPPGTRPGAALNAPLVLAWGGLVLPAGRYVFELHVGGELAARAPFQVGVGGAA